jgi:hypothetical protein
MKQCLLVLAPRKLPDWLCRAERSENIGDQEMVQLEGFGRRRGARQFSCHSGRTRWGGGRFHFEIFLLANVLEWVQAHALEIRIDQAGKAKFRGWSVNI